ncbi:MAG: SDR family oxidoreductase [Mycobacteriales bacterium]|nr:SDR family oxidoreductase [Mycobacteriales bacterium]
MTRTAVVTGCEGGIGSAVVMLLREQGWRVVGLDRSGVPALAGTHRRIDVDLTDPADVTRAVELLAEEAPAGLVNNAAEQILRPLRDLTASELSSVLQVNVVAPHQLTARLANTLEAVVNVASVHALATTDQMASYATSKAALVSYSRAAAVELGPRTRVNAVLPGATDTPMLRAGWDRDSTRTPQQALAALESRTPLARIAGPREIAHTVAFLLDDERSGFITGQSFVVDGGVTARLASE